jgi:predicted MFS family arabinose efflux permease
VLSGIALLAAATALMPLFSSIVLVALVSVIFGLAVSISTVATSSYVAEVVKKEQIGASIGALSSLMDIGHSSGPFVAGLVITAVNIAAGFWAGAAACVLAVVVFAVMVLGGRTATAGTAAGTPGPR